MIDRLSSLVVRVFGSARTFLILCLIASIAAASAAVGGTPIGVLSAALASAWPLLPLSLGAAIVIAAGEIDLSVAGAISMHGMLTLYLANDGWSPTSVIVLSMVVAIALAVVNGCAVVLFEIPSLIATLSLGLVCAGVALFLDSRLATAAFEISDASAPIVTRTLPARYQPTLFQVTWPWAIGWVFAAFVWRFRTLSGLRLLAVGLDREAAHLAVLPVSKVRYAVLLISAVSAWLSAMLLQIGFQGGGWNPGTGRGLELVAVIIAVLGGTRITGGVFDPVAVLLAAIMWQATAQLQYVVPGLGPETQLLFTGVIVIGVAFMQSRQKATFL